MKKGIRIPLKIALWTAGIFCGLVLLLQIGLNSGPAVNYAKGLLDESLDCNVKFSRMHVSLLRSFPNIRVTIDTLSLTYPHDRFAAYDVKGPHNPMLDEGRGEVEDTLARFDRFTAAVNPWRIIRGKIRLRDAHLHNIRAFVHFYDEGKSNLDIMKKKPEEETPEDTSALTTPWLSIGPIDVARDPHIVYTDQKSGVYANVDFRRLHVLGDLKFDPGDIKVRDFAMSLDTLAMRGTMNSDTLSFSLDSLCISEPEDRVFKLGLGAVGVLLNEKFGTVHIPVGLSARVGYEFKDGGVDVDLPEFSANVAYIPLRVVGKARLREDRVGVDADVFIRRADLGAVWNDYGPVIIPKFADMFKLDSHLDLKVSVKGDFSEKSNPLVNATTVFDFGIPGVNLDMKAAAEDVLGDNPFVDLDARADASLAKLDRRILAWTGISGSGDLKLDVKAAAALKELQDLKADLNARLSSKSLDVSIPGGISLKSGDLLVEVEDSKKASALSGNVNIGSVHLVYGDSLALRVRDMKNSMMMKTGGKSLSDVHNLAVTSSAERIFFSSGGNRLGIRGVHINADASRRKQWLGVRPIRPIYRPDYMREESFRSSDLDISLDSTSAGFLKKWNPSASVVIEGARVIMPGMPLKTRVNALDLNYKDDNFDINELSAQLGSSDLSVRGSFKGIGRALRRRGFIFANLDIDSKRINANELLAAYNAGGKAVETDADAIGASDNAEARYEDKVVTDLSEAEKPDSMRLIILPANVRAKARLMVERVDWSDLNMKHFVANADLRERTLLLTSTAVQTDAGNISLEGYYSTRTRKDLAAAANIRFADLTAEKIIQLLPDADSLMPMIRSFKGKMSMDVAVTTQVDTNMNVQLPQTEGVIRIKGKDMRIDDAGDLRKVTRLLLFRNKNIGPIGDLSVDAILHDSRIEVFPFIFTADRYMLALNGRQGIDRNFDYCATILKWPLLFPFGINLYGNFDSWKFRIGAPMFRAGSVPSFTEDVNAMQKSISQSIRNVFKYGHSHSKSMNRKQQAFLEEKRKRMYGKSGNIPDAGEEKRVMNNFYASEADDELQRVLREVDETLGSKTSQFGDNLDKLYEELTTKKKKRK